MKIRATESYGCRRDRMVDGLCWLGLFLVIAVVVCGIAVLITAVVCGQSAIRNPQSAISFSIGAGLEPAPWAARQPLNDSLAGGDLTRSAEHSPSRCVPPQRTEPRRTPADSAGLSTIGGASGTNIAKGASAPAAPPLLASQSSILNPQSAMLFVVTAYCPCRRCCGPHARGITASGTRADHRLVAGPPSMPFGQVLEIPGYGRVRCEDRGGAIKGQRLDVLFPTHEQALAWGVKTLRIAN